MPPEPWRNRIVGEGEEAPDQLLANPFNFRIHPKAQQDGVSGSLNDLGWIQRIIVNRATGHVIDGHARVELAISRGEPSVPVVYVDVTPEEERKALAVFDALGALAAIDGPKLGELLASISTEDPDLERMLTDLAGANGVTFGMGGREPEADNLEQEVARATLAERFLIPPFSVLDARQGYWQERKRAWLALGIRSELGRGETLTYVGREDETGESDATCRPVSRPPGPQRNGQVSPGGSPGAATRLNQNGKTERGDGAGHPLTYKGQESLHVNEPGSRSATPAPSRRMTYATGSAEDFTSQRILEQVPAQGSGTSIFDPVLCEVVYRWFCPPGGRVLDPFAGGSVRGVVASLLGRSYTGIDLSEAQVVANRGQGEALCSRSLDSAVAPMPRWFMGDSSNIAADWPPSDAMFDLVFSCPPYFDLEVYTDSPADLSQAPDYEAFVDALGTILTASAGRLADDRFVVLVMGEARNGRGDLYGLVPGTVKAAGRAGLTYYNEAILVTMVGSLPLRVGRAFPVSRKLGRTHQTVLVFVKGDATRAAAACGHVEVGDVPESVNA